MYKYSFMKELLEQNQILNNPRGQEVEKAPPHIPEANFEDFQQALTGLQWLEWDVAVTQDKIQLNEQQEQLLRNQLKKINDLLRDIDRILQTNDSLGGRISWVRNSRGIGGGITPMWYNPLAHAASKAATHNNNYKWDIVSKILEVDRLFSILNRQNFMSSNKNKGRYLELNKMYSEMINGIGETYNGVPKITKDIKNRLSYANTILPTLPLVDVHRSQQEKLAEKKLKENWGFAGKLMSTVKKNMAKVLPTEQEQMMIKSADGLLNSLEQKLKESNVSYNEQAQEKAIPYFKWLYQQVYQKIQDDQTLDPAQKKQKVLRLACIITGRSQVYKNREQNAPKITYTANEWWVSSYSVLNYDRFRKEWPSSSTMSDKFRDPEFAEQILHRELLGSEDLSDKETVFAKIINNAGIPVEHSFKKTPQELFKLYGNNPQRNLLDPSKKTIENPLTREKTTFTEPITFESLPYRDRLQYVILDKFLDNQTQFLSQEMSSANVNLQTYWRTQAFQSVEEFSTYLQDTGRVEQYDSQFHALLQQAQVSTGDIVKEKLPDYLKQNEWFGKWVRSKDFPWLKDKYDKAILDAYQNIVWTGWTLSDTNAMAVKEWAKIVAQIGASLAAGFIIPGWWLAGLSTVARLAVTASVMATTNVVANQLINNPDYIDPFEAITDVSTQLVFDFSTIFLGGLAMQKFGYGFKSFAQTFSKRWSINRALSLGDLTAGVAAENFRQSFFLGNVPMGFWEQFKSPIWRIGFISMMFGVKNLNKNERNNLKTNYAKLRQYVGENPQIRDLHLDFNDLNGKKQFITVGELLDNIDLKKWVKLTDVPKLSADIDKIKPIQQVDDHLALAKKNANLTDKERAWELEKQLQAQNLLGNLDEPIKLTDLQRQWINDVHNLSNKTLNEIEKVYADKDNFTNNKLVANDGTETRVNELSDEWKEKIKHIIQSNDPNDEKPAVLQHTSRQLVLKKKVLQDIYWFDKKQAHYLVKSWWVWYSEGISFFEEASKKIESIEGLMWDSEDHFINKLKESNLKATEKIISGLKTNIESVQKNIKRIEQEITELKTWEKTPKKTLDLEDLNKKKIQLSRSLEEIQTKYKTRVSLFRDYAANKCKEEIEKVFANKKNALLLDKYSELDWRSSKELQTTVTGINELQKKISELEAQYLWKNSETKYWELLPNYEQSVRQNKSRIEEIKREITWRKELIESKLRARSKIEKQISDGNSSITKYNNTIKEKMKSSKTKKSEIETMTEDEFKKLENEKNKLKSKLSELKKEKTGNPKDKSETFEDVFDKLDDDFEKIKKQRSEALSKQSAMEIDKEIESSKKTIEDFLNPTAGATSSIDIKWAKAIIGELRQDYDRLKNKLQNDPLLGSKIKEWTMTRAGYLKSLLNEINELELKVSRKEVEWEYNNVIGQITDAYNDRTDASKVSIESFNKTEQDLYNLEALLKDKKLLDEKFDPSNNDPSAPKYRDEIKKQKQTLSDAKREYEVHKLNQLITNTTDWIDAIYKKIDTHPNDYTAEDINNLSKKVDELENKVNNQKHWEQIQSGTTSLDNYIKEMRDKIIELKTKHRQFGYKNELKNDKSKDWIEDLYSKYNQSPIKDETTLDMIEKLISRLDELEKNVRNSSDWDKNIPDKLPEIAFWDHIAQQKEKVVELKKKVWEHHATNAANNVKKLLEKYENLVKSTGTIIDDTELTTIKSTKIELDEAIKKMDDEKVKGREKLDADSKSKLEDITKKHETIINRIVNLTEIKSKLEPFLHTYLDDVLLSNDPPDQLIKNKINTLPRANFTPPFFQRRHKLLNLLSDAHLISMLLDAWMFDISDIQLKELKRRNESIINALEWYRRSDLTDPDASVRKTPKSWRGYKVIDKGVNILGSLGKWTYRFTIQESLDSLLYFWKIAKKYRASSNPIIKKYGSIMESESNKLKVLTWWSAYDFADAKEWLALDIEELAKYSDRLKNAKPSEMDGMISSVLSKIPWTMLGKFIKPLEMMLRWLFREKIFTMLYTTYWYMDWWMSNALVNRLISSHLISSNAFGSKTFVQKYIAPMILRLLIIWAKEYITWSREQTSKLNDRNDAIIGALKQDWLDDEYTYYFSDSMLEWNNEAKRTKSRADNMLSDKSETNDKEAISMLSEYFKGARLNENINTNPDLYDQSFVQYFNNLSDTEKSYLSKSLTPNEIDMHRTVISKCVEKERSKYVGKHKKEIPSWILFTTDDEWQTITNSDIEKKYIDNATQEIKNLNINIKKTYEEVIWMQPWIQDFISKDAYQNILSSWSRNTEAKKHTSSLDDEWNPCPQEVLDLLNKYLDEDSDSNPIYIEQGWKMNKKDRIAIRVWNQ